MKDFRCLVGRHEWSTNVPEGTPQRHGEARVACARCGKVVRAGSGDDPRLGGPLLRD